MIHRAAMMSRIIAKRHRCSSIEAPFIISSPLPSPLPSSSSSSSSSSLSSSSSSWWSITNRGRIRITIRGILSDAVKSRVESMVGQYDEIAEQMSRGDASSSSLGKRLSVLAPVAKLNERLTELEEEERTLLKLWKNSAGDEELKELCVEEMEELSQMRFRLEEKMLECVLPTDPDDVAANAIVEVRSGAGGDEASLFASELLDVYTRTARSKHWKAELLSETRNEFGGIKEAALSVSVSGSGGSGRRGGSYHGDFSYGNDDADGRGGGNGEDEELQDPLASLGPYGFFKFESGGHRVQRVPVNDVRIHTSACTVAVLPSPPEDHGAADPSSLLPTSDLRIETMRASGAGGQHVNTTESAVRITHLPTGITATIQDERSQHKNRAKAMKLVTARVRDRQRDEEARARGEARNSLMGGGDRSERIRTYNFPQDRVTDHRCKQSEHGISKLFHGTVEDGLVTTFAPFMRAMHREELMKVLEEQSEKP